LAEQSIFLKPTNNPSSSDPDSVAKFIMAKTGKAPGIGSGRLIFALDATASRAPLWDMARGLTGDMIREVGRLQLQLIYFRGGLETPPQCSASAWISDPAAFAVLMGKVGCQAGYTQITRALTHAKTETTREKVGAVVLIGDACEPAEDNLDRIGIAARALGDVKTPVFAFLEGRDQIAETGFRKIAELSGGAFGRFDAGGVKQLGELLRAVALYTTGGLTALASRKDAASVLLLGQLRA
jgi:hypothetical protein